MQSNDIEFDTVEGTLTVHFIYGGTDTKRPDLKAYLAELLSELLETADTGEISFRDVDKNDIRLYN